MQTLPLDSERLREIFGRAVRWSLAGTGLALPAAALLLGAACGPCPPVDEIYLLREPDARIQTLVDACRDPASPQCGPLCAAVSGRPEGVLEHCEMHKDRDGYFVVHVGWNPSCPGGRRPRRLAFGHGRRTTSAAGQWFAELCQLEAASVPAFETLEAELEHAEAPRPLVSAARAAAGDERRHTRLAARLAERFDAAPARPVVGPSGDRALGDMAEENIVEGCVREAYGAALAMVQATTAVDPVVRAAMQSIAIDETRHAALALAVHRWAAGRLGARAQARVADAGATAVQQLRASAGCDWSPVLGATIGLPPPPVARALVDHLSRTLWA